MTYEERRTIVRDTDPATPSRPPPREVVRDERVTRRKPSRAELMSRVVVFVFGLVELVIALRILFLLLDARQANGIVRAILDLSRPLAAPFEGILRTNALSGSGSTLDVTAFVALVGWAIVELVVLALIRIGRREPWPGME